MSDDQKLILLFGVIGLWVWFRLFLFRARWRNLWGRIAEAKKAEKDGDDKKDSEA